MYGQESASGSGLSSLRFRWPPVLLGLMDSRSEQAEEGWKYQSQPRAFTLASSAPGNDNVELTAETLSSSIPYPPSVNPEEFLMTLLFRFINNQEEYSYPQTEELRANAISTADVKETVNSVCQKRSPIVSDRGRLSIVGGSEVYRVAQLSDSNSLWSIDN